MCAAGNKVTNSIHCIMLIGVLVTDQVAHHAVCVLTALLCVLVAAWSAGWSVEAQHVGDA
jgi:hypothetical protein